jgi:hypothetical protein
MPSIPFRRIDVFERIPHGARGYGERVWDARDVSQLVKFAQAHPPAKVNDYLECVEPGKVGYKPETISELIEMVARKTVDPTRCQLGPNTLP